MTDIELERFHQMYGLKRPRLAYRRNDFLDYLLMSLVSSLVIIASYGLDSMLTRVGVLLCALLVVGFGLRHGIQLKTPLLLRRPQDIAYMLIYKLRNMTPMFLAAVGLFLLDNAAIALTPGLPHHAAFMHRAAMVLFYAHFSALCIYRTAILIAYLRKRDHVGEVLRQTPWKTVIERQPNMTLQIVHAYCTGLLTHIILLAPWYLIITYSKYSVLTFPIVFGINVLNHLLYLKTYNAWFYRDHWLGHHSEFEFLYLHGTHHDALPTGLIGVSGNGYLEGFFRHTMGNPTAFYTPLMAFLLYSIEVQQDIVGHQHVPGVYPTVARNFHEVAQHSTHHWWLMEPYSVGFRAKSEKKTTGFQFPPEEILNSISLDEQLGGFEWDNARHAHFMKLFDKYQKEPRSSRAAETETGP